MRHFLRRHIFQIVALLACLGFLASCADKTLAPPESPSDGPRNFSFVQISDIHVSPMFEEPREWNSLRSYSCTRTLRDLGATPFPDYGVTAPAPSFVLATGDVTEFGFPGITGSVVDRYFEGLSVPVYMVAGNHDNTWVAPTQEFRNRWGGMNYSFEYKGCRFIGLCTATFQEPVPSISEEVLGFVRKELARIDRSTPIFIFPHHPLWIGEFCSRYDVDRLVDLLRGHNVVLFLDGHGHSAIHKNVYGIDSIQGGSPFAKTPGAEGYNIVYIDDSTLYAAYRYCDPAKPPKPLLTKSLVAPPPDPDIRIHSPEESATILGASLKVAASIRRVGGAITRAYCELDDERTEELSPEGSRFVVSIPLDEVANGAHFLRVNFVDEAGTVHHRSTSFFVERAGQAGRPTALWRARMAGGTKATPLVGGDTVYLGANDGLFRALDRADGSLRWAFDAGAEILVPAAQWNDSILFGAGNGRFFALSPRGKLLWSHQADAAIFSPPVVDENGVVYFGANDASLTALDAQTGALRWKNTDARYSVESAPFVAGEHVYFGAWDGYLYCLNRSDGATVWKAPGPRNRERVITYFAPADNGPVVAGNRIFIADRGYHAAAYSDDNGKPQKTFSEDCAALALSTDTAALYLRGTKTPLRKITLDGEGIWESDVVLGRLPISPVEAEGIVYACTNSGTLHALDGATGKRLWHYQVSPKLYVMSGVAVQDGIAYASGLDGWVTAVAPPAPSRR